MKVCECECECIFHYLKNNNPLLLVPKMGMMISMIMAIRMPVATAAYLVRVVRKDGKMSE